MRALREAQRAMASAILTDAPLAIPAPCHPRVDPAAAFAIHRRHFVTSLREALAATFPAVVRLVGEGFFAYAAAEFARRHPPVSPCLSEYGRDFPQFLSRFAPCAQLAYLPDCARLEWLLHEAACAPIAHPIDWRAVEPGSYAAAARLRLQLDPALRFLVTRWPVDAIVEIARADRDAGELALSQGDLLLQIRRIGREVRTARLNAAVFAFRAALAGGVPIEDAFDQAAKGDLPFDLAAALAALVAEGAVVGLIPGAAMEDTP